MIPPDGGSMPRAFLSVDVEQDISVYLDESYMGLETGLPALLDLFHEEGVVSDFFVQGSLVPRFEGVLAEIRAKGHPIGVHGLHHRRLFLRPGPVQRRQLTRATELVSRVAEERPVMFRSPGFSANEATIDILEKLGYRLDSSVMPGAVLRMLRRRITVRDFRAAPRRPYHPAEGDFLRPGSRRILEVPLTENPRFQGAPLGLGYLNTFGIRETLEAIRQVREPDLVFLIHTWEASDLRTRFPGLPEYVRNECSEDLEPLRNVVGFLKEQRRLASFTSLVS